MFEEVKEMIDATVYENGRGEVTAKNLNLAMHGVVDATEEELGKVNDAVKTVEDKVTAIEENGTGGDVAYVYGPYGNQLSDVQIEENKKSYVKILNGADLKVNIIGTICNAEFYCIESGAITFGVIAHVTAENSSGARIYHHYFLCTLSNDGTVIVDAVDDYNTPASSGPLRVWINEMVGGENDSEQTAENIATFKAMWNDKPQHAILSAVMGMGGFPMMIALPVVVYRLISENGEDMISMTYRDIIDQGNGLEIMETYVYLKQDGTVTIEY